MLLLVEVAAAALTTMTVRLLVTPLTLSIFIIALLIATLALGLVLSLLSRLLMVGRVEGGGRVGSPRRLKSSRRGSAGACVDLLEVNRRGRVRFLFLLLLGIVHDRGPIDGLAGAFRCCSGARLALTSG